MPFKAKLYQIKIMVGKNSTGAEFLFLVRVAISRLLGLLAVAIALQSSAFGGQWFITPSLSISELFSDNINLSPSGSEKSAFVRQVTPAISILRTGGRTNLNLTYQMQNILNQGGNGGVNIRNQLFATAASELVRNRLFLNANSTISQQNIVNTGLVTTGNINATGNRTDVYTFSVRPVWTPRLGGYANGVFQLGYDLVNTSTAATGNSNTYSVNAQLQSGYKFSNIAWRMGYNDTYSDRSLGGNVRFRNYDGEIRYFFSRRYAVFLSAGNSSNSFPTNTNVSQNGTYYLAGLAWTPSSKLAVEGGYGKNLRYLQVQIAPTIRTTMVVRFQNSDVGTNTGDVWNASLTHQTGRTSWQASYSEDTTTTQQILLNQNPFNLATFNTATGLSVTRNLGLPSLTNQVLVRKQGQLSVSGVTGRSTLNMTLFHSRREFQVSLTKDDSIGVIGFWNWRFSPRTNSILQLSWNRNTTSGAIVTGFNRRNNVYNVSLRLTRNIADYFNIAKNINGSIEYSFLKQNSSDPTVSYNENQVLALLNILF